MSIHPYGEGPSTPSAATPPTVNPAEGESPPTRPPTSFDETLASSTSGDLPRRFGHYELLAEAARGGMGIVYRARDTRLNNVVALKMMLPAWSASRQSVERFLTEARAVVSLRHEFILPLHEFGEVEGHVHYTMPWMPNGTLQQLVAAGPLTPSRAARVVERLARAVHYAHEQGVIHRDIKPQNVLLAASESDDIVPMLADFGLARTSDSSLSRTGEAIGTPSYMPPEQARGQLDLIGPASDVYGLGSLLYCLLTGRPPFQSADVPTTMRMVCEDPPISPRRLNPDVPLDLETICLKCLEKEPQRRYRSARELTEELTRFIEGRPVLARPVGPLMRGLRWSRRRPASAALLVVAFLVPLLAAGVGWLLKEQAEDVARLEQQARLSAEDGERKAAEGERTARAATRKAETSAYALQLQLALQELLKPDGGRALELLTSCNPAYHNWEHRYLTARADRCLATMRGHRGEVRSVVVSRDGKRIASGGADGTVRLWDVETLQPLKTLKGHDAPVHAVAFAPDSRRVASAGKDGTVRLWDADGGALKTLKEHTDEVTGLVFLAEGRLVSSGKDAVSRVWNVDDGRVLLTRKEQTNREARLVAAPDGRSIATVHEQWNPLVIWNVEDGKDRQQIATSASCASFSPDGKRLATGGSNVMLWQTATRQGVATAFAGKGMVRSVVFSPDGLRFAAVASSEWICLCNAATGAIEIELKGPNIHDKNVNGMAFTPDSERLVTAGDDGTVKVWNVGSGTRACPIMTPDQERGGMTDVSFSPDGGTVRAVCGKWAVRVVDVRTGRPLAQMSGGGLQSCIDHDPTGARFATSGPGGKILIWDATEGKRIREWDSGIKQVDRVRFDAEGRHLVTAGISTDVVKVWNVETGEPVRSLRGGWGLAVGRDGQLASGSRDGIVRVWDGLGEKELYTLSVSQPSALAFSTDGRLLAVGGQSKEKDILSAREPLRLFRADTGEPVLTFRGHVRAISGMAFFPDGKRLATTGLEGTLKIWDVETGEELLTLEDRGNILGTSSVAVSPDGRYVATGNGAALVRIWDAGK